MEKDRSISNERGPHRDRDQQSQYLELLIISEVNAKMGAADSKSSENQLVEDATEAATDATLRALQEENVKLREQLRVQQFHRELKAREDEKLKQARADWKREEAARLQEEKQRFLWEQQTRAQSMFQHQPWQQPVPHPSFQQIPKPPLQQMSQPLCQEQPLMMVSHPVPLQPLYQQVPPPLFQQVLQRQGKINQPLLQQAPQPQAPTLKLHQPRPRLSSAPSTSRTSKSITRPHELTSTVETKDFQRTKTRSRSASFQRAPLKATFMEWKDTDYIQEMHGSSISVAENIISLFNKQNTIPFIARYRKHMTLGMDMEQLRNIKTTYERGILMKHKANALIKKISQLGQWAIPFCSLVHETRSLNKLEWMQSIFHAPSSSRLQEACQNGLLIPAAAIIQGQSIGSLHFYVKQGRVGLNSKEQVMAGIVCIIADMIFKNANTFKTLEMLRKIHRANILVTRVKGEIKKSKVCIMSKQCSKSEYDVYHNFSSLETDLEPSQIWDIIRGEEMKMLTVRVNLPHGFETDFMEYCAREYNNACYASSMHKTLLTTAYHIVWNESIKGSVCKQIMYELKDRAQATLLTDFAKDVKKLLLTPPVKKTKVIGIHPGVCDGCKLAVVSKMGEVLETASIHPHDEDNSKGKIEAERILAGMILLHNCTLLALGNSTNYQKTEKFLGEFLQKSAFDNLQITYRIVDEKETSLYVKCKEASTEFPDFDVDVLSAISVARRVQDPMAELVKIDSTQLCNAFQQHDIPTTQLIGKLNEVITDIVSYVGVDANTASISLLRRVSGLNESTAKNIIEWRKSSGPFRTRDDLKKIPGICEKTFEQCAGFIRIIPETVIHIDERISKNSLDCLDQTSIHPESYGTARAFLIAAKCDLRQFGTKHFISGVKLAAKQESCALAKKLNTTMETMQMIVDGLSEETVSDVREKSDLSKPHEKSSSFDGLKVGDIFTGVVRSKAAFGLFIDIGLGADVLLHNSKMRGATLDIGRKIKVKVSHVDKKRDRIGVAYMKCL